MTADLEQPIAAAIDIGSNSIKMTIGRQVAGGAIEQIDWASEVVRLGQGVAETGRLSDDRIDAAVQALRQFANRARALGAQEIVAVATEATRAAGNGLAFLDRVKDETGIDVRIVDGLEEATLTFRGLSATTDVSGNAMIADVGGGSTELIVVADGSMMEARSISLGSGRLTERHIRADPPTLEELASCESEATAEVQSAVNSMKRPQREGVRLIVVGGTGEFMARLVPDETAIDRNTVRAVLGKLTVLTAAELADEIEAPESRARVLPAGVAIVAAIANGVSAEHIEIARSGIRAGLLVEAFERIESSDIHPSPPASTDELGRGVDVASNGKRASRIQARQEAPFREMIMALIGERWRTVWKTIPAALEGSDIEGVHDVRVASRRLRAAMDVAAPVFPQRWFKSLHKTAKEITGALGEVRDRDVLLVALRTDRAAAPVAEHPGIDRLIDRIEGERVMARVEMERFLTSLTIGSLGHEIERRFSVDLAQPREFDAVEGKRK